MNIPNGSIINFFTSGGPNHGCRFEIVKASPTKPPAVIPEGMKRLSLDDQLDPGRIYEMRRACLRAKDNPIVASRALLSAADIYAARRLTT